MLSRTDASLLDLLTDPETVNLAKRELGCRTGFDHKFVAGFRAALKAVYWGPAQNGNLVGVALGPSLSGLPYVPGKPPSMIPSTPGHTILGMPPSLNSFDCWVMLTDRERAKFVGAVGLHQLLAAAPADHRDTFLRDIGRSVSAEHCQIEEDV